MAIACGGDTSPTSTAVPPTMPAALATVAPKAAPTPVATSAPTPTQAPVTAEFPTVSIDSPKNLDFFGDPDIEVTGVVADPFATVLVNGVTATVSGGQFMAQIELEEGNHTITALARNLLGEVDSSSIQVTLDTTPPKLVIGSPPDGFVTNEPLITASGMINDTVVGTVNGDQAQVTINGEPAEVANRSFLGTEIPLSPGPNTITAVGVDRAGNTATASITVIFEEITEEPVIRLVSGNNQTGPIGERLAQPLVVEVTDSQGNPAIGETVIFKVMENNGTLSASPEEVRSIALETDSGGRAQVHWDLGTRSGAGNNTVDATAVGFQGMAIFTATAVPAAAEKINVDAGNNQTGIVLATLPKPFIAVVTDEGHNRLGKVPVTFTVVEGGGSFDGQPNITLETDSDGRALANLTVGAEEGFDVNVVEANFPGNQGFSARFVASGLIPADPRETRVTGIVLDNSDEPVPGVTMAIHGTNLAVRTDADGLFEIKPAPVGNVVLVANGTTAQRPGIWPTLTFDLVTVAGKDNTIGMAVHLLPLDSDSALQVDDDTGGTLDLEAVPGFSLTIAPGSATFPDGSTSGEVTVTVVNNEKIPMVPNFGQQPRFIVTIQPAGVIFDPPAPITLPNVDFLLPGEVTEMYSFDHDLGQFVSIGTGTVSEDGMVIASDPGVGIIKGGWHCGGNPTETGSAENAHVRITSEKEVELEVGESATVTATGEPNPGTYSWTSSDLSILTFDSPTTGRFTNSVTVRRLKSGGAVISVIFTCQSGAVSVPDSALFGSEGSISITSLDPGGPDPGGDLELGELLAIDYKIDPGDYEFDGVRLEIRNGLEQLVFREENLAASGGDHTAFWEEGKWNQAPHSGAFANPKNGPYEIKLIGTKDGEEQEDVALIETRLIITADVKDEQPAGLSNPIGVAGLGDLVDALKVVMKLGSQETVISGASNITVTGATRNEKFVSVDSAVLNSLPDGAYVVEFRDVRDEIGNFAEESFAIELR